MDHFGKKSTFWSKLTPKSGCWRPLDSSKKSKIVKHGSQNVYEVHQGNCSGLFIKFWLQDWSFWQKVHFLVKMDYGNQPNDVSLILTKNEKFLEIVYRMFMNKIMVIIRDYLSILCYYMDHFVKMSTFWSKWLSEISLVVPLIQIKI